MHGRNGRKATQTRRRNASYIVIYRHYLLTREASCLVPDGPITAKLPPKCRSQWALSALATVTFSDFKKHSTGTLTVSLHITKDQHMGGG